MSEKWNLQIVAAISAFVFFELGTLAINYQISRQVEADAKAINLAGRQRMLSQQITKASILAANPLSSVEEQDKATKEAASAYTLFRSTLSAFTEGGAVPGSDGRPVFLQQVKGSTALQLGKVNELTDQWASVPASRPEMEKFSRFWVENNLAILDSMDRFTHEFERQSVETMSQLKYAHRIAFGLSLGNFVLILVLMQRARRRALHSSITDTLTGLHNRAGLYQALSSAIAEAERTGTPFGVMLLDLDGFKKVNDTYGHAAGDEVLKETAHRLLTWQRPGWVCGRIGGDEFAVICPGVPSDQMDQIARDLSNILSDMPARDLSVSASVGGASSEPGCNADFLMALADKAMYTEKSKKRSHGTYRANLR